MAKPGKFEDILGEQLWHGVSVTTTWALQSSKGPASPKRPGAGTNHDLCKYFFFQTRLNTSSKKAFLFILHRQASGTLTHKLGSSVHISYILLKSFILSSTVRNQRRFKVKAVFAASELQLTLFPFTSPWPQIPASENFKSSPGLFLPSDINPAFSCYGPTQPPLGISALCRACFL